MTAICRDGLRRARFSPDGTATVFQLPETKIQSVDYVKNLATQEDYPAGDYTADLEKGTVTFTTAPTKGTSTLEIGWTYPTNFRDQVLKMKFSEIFNGQNDNRVFIYGDGSNKAFYTGLDDNGIPRADYFPDMNELIVGEANTPITALIRHYSRLMAYKTDSAYSIQYGVTTLASGLTVPTYYNTPVNRTIGNAPPGQVRLCSFAYRHKTDHGETIRSYWESGSIAFDRDFMRKYSAMLWVGIKPEERAEVWVTIQTDRKSEYTQKLVIFMLTDDVDIIQKLDDEPNDVGGLSAAQLKEKFDEAGNILKTYLNETLLPAISDTVAGANIRAAAEQQRVENENARLTAESGRETAESAEEAEASRQAVENLGVEAETVDPGGEATVAKQVSETGVVTLRFGIPQGPQGKTGPQGPAGEGSGDMLAATYDPQGLAKDIFQYVDDSIQAAIGEAIGGSY